MKVAKFGGTSLADAGQFRKVCEIVKADPDRRIIVVSAPGRRQAGDAKVTDLLIQCAERVLSGQGAAANAGEVVARYAAIQRDLGLPRSLVARIRTDLDRRLRHRRGEPAGQYLDRVKAAGEDYAAQMMAAALRKAGLPAQYVSPREAGLRLSSEPGNAVVLEESYARLGALRAAPGITVFPGFFGYTAEGQIATFPRGGSDITGAVLAAAVRADLYENFTDVDSVCALDPQLVPEAPPIPLLTYREMRELAYAGFGVFHEEAILPAVKANIPICIRNTNRPEAPGTLVVPERKYTAGEVVGIASAEGFCTIGLSKYLMNREIGFGRRLLQILEEEGLSYEHTPSGIDNTSVILREKHFPPDVEGRVVARIRRELAPDDLDVERGLALIMIVGEGMRYVVGLAARATAALAGAGVNIEMLNQGSSEISMMFGVKAVDRKKAVRALYSAFFASRPNAAGAGPSAGRRAGKKGGRAGEDRRP